ncbi:hypothetical protein CKAN_01672500 [Cinnamomum micranthum f. kanehirae]|uniref:Uncharacterized protein n=1 Tax=Cinnamomum micranthum f. kanehirae TaxID=337451 RepID=A0A3S3PCJ3_9MAGN|nr:hypothetical protein CKAN_01672500 [Cinnamomum micranthum f. kanehirae]
MSLNYFLIRECILMCGLWKRRVPSISSNCRCNLSWLLTCMWCKYALNEQHKTTKVEKKERWIAPLWM